MSVEYIGEVDHNFIPNLMGLVDLDSPIFLAVILLTWTCKGDGFFCCVN